MATAPVPTLQGTKTTAVVQLWNSSPATDWSCADRKPGRAVHAFAGHWGRGGRQGWSQARLCNHIVWKGADRRPTQGDCHPSLSGVAVG